MTAIRCHYDVLSVARDADAAAIKKAHRKLALKHHPDKTVGKTEEEQHASAAEFKMIQVAYECLSDPVERKWYDEHREMILRGGMHGDADGGDGSTFVYDVVQFQYAGCYEGYDDDDPESFYSVYSEVFDNIFEGERDGYVSEGNIDVEKMSNAHLGEVHLGDSASDWTAVSKFYNAWEGFTSCLSFAWEDIYHLIDLKEAPNRRIRRLMEDDNRKKRRAAKKERVDEVCSLVRFVKRRDPRVKAQREKSMREQAQKEARMKKEAAQKKKDHALAKEEWRAEAERAMAEQEAADLDAGRVRLADLDSDDDYDYGGKRGKKKKKRKGKGKGGKKKTAAQNEDEDGNVETTGVDTENAPQDTGIEDETNGNAVDEEEKKDEAIPLDAVDQSVDHGDLCDAMDDLGVSSEESSEEEPDSWRCECCRKDFKSAKQFENHERSKKHKETLKKYEKKLQKEAEKRAALQEMMDELGDSETDSEWEKVEQPDE
ncbi:hypothetical protein ACHAXT_009981 [Thalassiosira profunda]